MTSKTTFDIEDKYMAPFFVKQKVSIENGKGIYVWDEEGNKYIDFTSGWGVTCIGHSHPVIVKALQEQGAKIIQNPNSGLTYSPARARLLSTMHDILPQNLTHVFFTNSGAEANDAAIKLARKVTNRTDIISTHQSFHGRTISTASATGQAKHREKFNHGGTYCGNPLGCAVADAVIRYLVAEGVSENVYEMGRMAIDIMNQWKQAYSDTIIDVRGVGLLLMIEFKDNNTAAQISEACLNQRLFVRQTQGTGIRIFPALIIEKDQLEEGLTILKEAIETVINGNSYRDRDTHR